MSALDNLLLQVRQKILAASQSAGQGLNRAYTQTDINPFLPGSQTIQQGFQNIRRQPLQSYNVLSPLTLRSAQNFGNTYTPQIQNPALRFGASAATNLIGNYASGFTNIAQGVNQKNPFQFATGVGQSIAPSLAMTTGLPNALLSTGIGAGLSGLGAKLNRQDPAQAAGKGAIQGLNMAGIGAVTNPLVNKATQFLQPAAGLAARQLVQRTAGGIEGLGMGEIMAKFDNLKTTNQDKALNFILGAALSGNDELGAALQKHLSPYIKNGKILASEKTQAFRAAAKAVEETKTMTNVFGQDVQVPMSQFGGVKTGLSKSRELPTENTSLPVEPSLSIQSSQKNPIAGMTDSLSGIGLQGADSQVVSSSDSIPNEIKYALKNKTPQPKERGFITSLKVSDKTPQELKQVINGTYTPRTNAELKQTASKLFRSNINDAQRMAINPRSATDVAIGQELLSYYVSRGKLMDAKLLAENMAKSGTELGQAVQAFSQYDKMTPAGALKFAQSKVAAYNRANPGKQLDLNSEQIQNLFDLAHNIQQMPDGRAKNIASQQLLEHVNNLIPSSIADKAITIWKAGLLTSFRTTERNILGNTIHGAAEAVKDIPAAIADSVMAMRTGKRTLTPTIQGYGQGFVKGLGQSKDIVSLGYDPNEAIQNFDVKHITWGDNLLEQGFKKYTDIVFRSLGAQDRPFWEGSFARSLYDQAGAEAINVGRQGDKAYIQKLVNDPNPQMEQTAISDANTATFHDKNLISKIAVDVKNEMGKSEISKVLGEIAAPFTGVPSSVTGQFINYSPIGLMKGIANAGRVTVQNLPKLQRQASQELGRGVVGTGIFGLGAYLAAKGLITGLPQDAKEQAQWDLEGKKPNSILINGQWRSIGSIGPEAIVALSGAKLASDLGPNGGGIAKYGADVGKDILNQPMLAGIQGPLNALSDPLRYGQSYLQGQAGSIIPNIVKDVAKSVDPFQRQVNGATDAVKYGIPGLRNSLVPKQDVLGNTQTNPQQGVGAFIDLFNSSPQKSNLVVNELSRLASAGESATPGKIGKSFTVLKQKFDLTPAQLADLNSAAGQVTQQQLTQVIQSPGYQTLSDQEKSDVLSKVIENSRKQVKDQTFTQGGVLPTGGTGETKIYYFDPTSGTAKTLDYGKVLNMPETNAVSRAMKQKAFDGLVSQTFNSEMSSEDKQRVYSAIGVTPQQAELSFISGQSNDVKAAYFVDQLQAVQKSGDTAAFQSYLTNALKNKSLTSGVMDQLVSQGVITSADKAHLLAMNATHAKGGRTRTKARKLKKPKKLKALKVPRMKRIRLAKPKKIHVSQLPTFTPLQSVSLKR